METGMHVGIGVGDVRFRTGSHESGSKGDVDSSGRPAINLLPEEDDLSRDTSSELSSSKAVVHANLAILGSSKDEPVFKSIVDELDSSIEAASFFVDGKDIDDEVFRTFIDSIPNDSTPFEFLRDSENDFSGEDDGGVSYEPISLAMAREKLAYIINTAKKNSGMDPDDDYVSSRSSIVDTGSDGIRTPRALGDLGWGSGGSSVSGEGVLLAASSSDDDVDMRVGGFGDGDADMVGYDSDTPPGFSERCTLGIAEGLEAVATAIADDVGDSLGSDSLMDFSDGDGLDSELPQGYVACDGHENAKMAATVTALFRPPATKKQDVSDLGTSVQNGTMARPVAGAGLGAGAGAVVAARGILGAAIPEDRSSVQTFTVLDRTNDTVREAYLGHIRATIDAFLPLSASHKAIYDSAIRLVQRDLNTLEDEAAKRSPGYLKGRGSLSPEAKRLIRHIAILERGNNFRHNPILRRSLYDARNRMVRSKAHGDLFDKYGHTIQSKMESKTGTSKPRGLKAYRRMRTVWNESFPELLRKIQKEMKYTVEELGANRFALLQLMKKLRPGKVAKVELHHLFYKAMDPKDAISARNLIVAIRGGKGVVDRHEYNHLLKSGNRRNLFRILYEQVLEIENMVTRSTRSRTIPKTGGASLASGS